MQTFKDLYQDYSVLNRNEQWYCRKVKISNFYEHMPVLVSQFFKISYLHTSKNIIFRTVGLIVIVKSNNKYCIEHSLENIVRLYLTYKMSRNGCILGLPIDLKPVNWDT